jgi:hypothetical protein
MTLLGDNHPKGGCGKVKYPLDYILQAAQP